MLEGRLHVVDGGGVEAVCGSNLPPPACCLGDVGEQRARLIVIEPEQVCDLAQRPIVSAEPGAIAVASLLPGSGFGLMSKIGESRLPAV